MRTTPAILAVCVLTTLVICAAPVSAMDRYVPDQHTSISAANLASQSGDRILVRPGVYPEFAIALRAGVTILGLGEAPGEVVIDAGYQGRVLRAVNLPVPATISNLTVRAGSAFGSSSVDGSGGALLVRNCDVILDRVHFEGNRATASGGAVRALEARPVFTDCEFRDNQAGQGGGALDASYGSTVVIAGTRFHANQAAWGGAASIRDGSLATITRADFVSNAAVFYPAIGGGIYCDHAAKVDVAFCTFVANSALYGGAMGADREARVTMTSCTLRLNLGAYSGGGLYLKAVDTVINHSLLAANTGRAVQCAVFGRVPTLSACDLWGNTGGDWTGPIENQRFTRFNIAADPLFCDDNDQHLAANSPCAAENSGVGLIGALGVGCVTQGDGGVHADPDSVVAGEPLVVFPNPFNPQTTVAFEVAAAGPVRVFVHDLRGAVVATLVDAILPRGRHSTPWRGEDDHGRTVASGTYLVSVQTGSGLVTRKILVTR